MTALQHGTPSVPARRAADAAASAPECVIERGHRRLLTVGAVFALAFVVIAGRLVDLTLLRDRNELRLVAQPAIAAQPRADIIDRNGMLLATTLTTASLYANPRRIIDAERAAAALARTLPGLDAGAVANKLASGKSFVWLKRGLAPRQQYAVNRLGIPGLAFQNEPRRVYPLGRLAAHVLGFSGIDNSGLAGIERFFDASLTAPGTGALALSLDHRVQHALADELGAAVRRHQAAGAAGLVLDVRTGETLALVSLPDFDPNRAGDFAAEALFNRATLGVYEMGSTFKAFTTAVALDAGVVKVSDGYDASQPIRIARYLIRDYHAKRRWLTVPEIFVYSSNIGAAKMALDVGGERQRSFLARVGLLNAPRIELPEVGEPLVPSPWRDINTMTVAFGHGIAVSPLQLAVGFAALANDGVLVPPTLVRREPGHQPAGLRVISADTSHTMRRLLRLVVEHGTGRKAGRPGYAVGGKTGTAEKSGRRGYRRGVLVSSFVGVFPMGAPRYLVLALLDEPRGTDATQGFATGGWTAAPVVGRVIGRVGPLLGVVPVADPSSDTRRGLLVAGTAKRGRNAAF